MFSSNVFFDSFACAIVTIFVPTIFTPFTYAVSPQIMSSGVAFASDVSSIFSVPVIPPMVIPSFMYLDTKFEFAFAVVEKYASFPIFFFVILVVIINVIIIATSIVAIKIIIFPFLLNFFIY